MQHLRLLGVSDDGSSLMLEGPDGTPYALPLDERVHAAMRGDRARLGQLQIQMENELTPREIQSRIRAGQTSEEIALAAQVPVERVRRFEGPVLMERYHIAQLAQSTNVRRVTDASAHPLSDLVIERLEARGVDPDVLVWDARRREDGRWAVRLEYVHGGRERSATWLFDHIRRTLEPHDDEAGWLTADERAVPEPSRGQRGRARTAANAPVPPAAEPEEAAAPPTPRLAAVPDVEDSPPPELADSLDDGFDESDDEAPVPDEPTAHHVPEVAPDADGPLRPTTGPKPARTGRRASVPSWDEILFGGGTAPED